MKKTEIAMIILIASISVLTAYFIAQATPLGNAASEPVSVPTIDRIETEVADPDPRVFNSSAINPQVDIHIDPDNLEDYTEYSEIEFGEFDEEDS